MTEYEYGEWLRNKHAYAIKPEKDKYTSIVKSNPNLHFISELLICRRATTIELLKCEEEGVMRDSYLKYLKMLENEIKKALILE